MSEATEIKKRREIAKLLIKNGCTMDELAFNEKREYKKILKIMKEENKTKKDILGNLEISKNKTGDLSMCEAVMKERGIE